MNNQNNTGRYVSVGELVQKRQIKHVSAGLISAESTDAINGSQLYIALQRAGVKTGDSKAVQGSTGSVTNVADVYILIQENIFLIF
ncbi:hypothetical protein [Pasteurella bettyae]|uniref:hypothetical protein n=1 Tax=Pasteurella bettyae TaxID=752 RepID=UPI001558BCEF|nr:hypothetical protein [Pasteurella bettyae]